MFDWLLLLPLLSRKLGGSYDRTDNLNNIAPPFPVHDFTLMLNKPELLKVSPSVLCWAAAASALAC